MKDSGRGAVVVMRILDIFVDFLDHAQSRGNSRVQVEHIGIYLMSVLLLDRFQAIPQRLRGELGFVAALHTVEEIVAVRLVEILGAQVNRGLTFLLRGGAGKGSILTNGTHKRRFRVYAGTVPSCVLLCYGILFTGFLAQFLGFILVILEHLLSFRGSTQRRGDHQEVLLPVMSGTLGHHSWGDLRE